MNKHSPLSHSGSLLERAAELYGFGGPVAARAAQGEMAEAAPKPEPEARQTTPEPKAPERLPALRPVERRSPVRVDRDSLREKGFIVPGAPAGPLAEEFRIVKRQLLLGAGAGSSVAAEKRRTILVCSAQPDEGKTFCAVNLALSMAGERGLEVLLVDGDFPKPEILSILGIERSGAGFVDALADPSLDPEALVVPTDIAGLSVMSPGRHQNDVPELLGSERTREVLARLTGVRDDRIVIFDSPPALMATAASALATHVGQLMLVVRADQTTEADLKEACGLLSGCGQISLLLNGTGFAATGRRFGSYYGYGQ
jgi:Mrp family chromosome partitioning ATPase